MQKKYSKFLFIVPFLIFSLGIYFVSPESIVNYVGVKNSYVFMFCIALIGGVSIFSGVPYPLILITLALGWLDPLLLWFFAASWVILGDSTSYLVGKKSEKIFSRNMHNMIDKVFVVYDKYPKYLPYFFLIYWICSPFPNDIITISAGMKGYSFWKTMIPLWIGNLIFCYSLARFCTFFSQYFV